MICMMAKIALAATMPRHLGELDIVSQGAAVKLLAMLSCMLSVWVFLSQPL